MVLGDIKPVCGSEVFEGRTIQFEIFSYSVDFKVFNSGQESELDLFLEGSIKYDGYSNWDFKDSMVLVHFCGRQEAVSIGRLIDRLYDIVEKNLPTVNIELLNS